MDPRDEVRRCQLGVLLSVRYFFVAGSVPTGFFLFFSNLFAKTPLVSISLPHRTGRDLTVLVEVISKRPSYHGCPNDRPFAAIDRPSRRSSLGGILFGGRGGRNGHSCFLRRP